MKRVVQRFLALLIGTCVLALLLHTFVLMGLVSPVYVSAGSMAPHLLGPHWELTCPECGARYDVGADAAPQAGRTGCPDCAALVIIGNTEHRRGDRLLVDRATFAFRPPRRWEAVVFRCPHDARTLCIKRVIGLPGEVIQFDRGDVLADGVVQRKSIGEQEALRVLVHRERAEARGWHPGDRETVWNWDTRGWRAGTGNTKDRARPADWLEFVPPRERTVTDRIPYNAGVPAIENATGDLMLAVRVAADGSGNLWIDCGRIRGQDPGDGRLLVVVSPRRRTAWIQKTPQLQEEMPAAGLASTGVEVFDLSVSLFDRQVLVVIDGREALREPLPQPVAATERPLAIAAADLDVALYDLAVWRDVVYTDQPGGSQRAGSQSMRWPLAAHEYLVVGDNPPISRDSRTWPRGPGLREEFIVGRPLGGG